MGEDSPQLHSKIVWPVVVVGGAMFKADTVWDKQQIRQKTK